MEIREVLHCRIIRVQLGNPECDRYARTDETELPLTDTSRLTN
jgi:hypothetical protein